MDRRLAAILAADVVGYSRLMGEDEAGTLAALKSHRRELIDPKASEHNGRTIKLMGDGALMVFASVVDAVGFAIEVQTAMRERNAEVPEDRRIVYRIGINIGDVIVEGDDIYGDGVNIAARLEALAEPGGICLSQQAFDQVEAKIDAKFFDLGERKVKNIARPLHVYAVALRDDEAASGKPRRPSGKLHQDIRFCTAVDGTQIAYASLGEGPTLVKTANWLNHLEYDWESPIWRHLLQRLARDHRLVRYDERGNGLSDWEVEDISFEAFVQDLETVVDAAGLERFSLFGVSQGCAVSIAYAVRHPERVSRMVLYGGYARGRQRRGSEDAAQSEALLTLMRQGWGQDNPAFRQFFTSLFLPEGSHAQIEWFNDLQRISASPENAARIRRAMDEIDVTALLPQVSVPTLVLHCRNDAVQPFSEGRRMAATIPDARFVALEGRNHLILEGEPAWYRLLEELEDFLGD